MNFKRVIAALCTAFMIVASVAVSAAESNIELVFEDVTSSDASTMSGEAKIKVSIKGAEGSIKIAQLGLIFDGDLKYSSIDMLINENNPDSGSATIYPNAAEANATKKLNMSVISAKKPMTFADVQPICILTFSGETGKSVTVKGDADKTYCSVGMNDKIALKDTSVTGTATASDTDVKSTVAQIKVVMDKVEGFLAKIESDDYQTSGVLVKITNEKRPSNVFYTYLNNVTISNGGNRDGDSSVPTFIIKQNVLADDTYTVEVSALGYVSYKTTGVKFDKTVEVTNTELVPGDVNGDGVVNADDKKLAEAAAADGGEYSEAADFNRDGKIDKFDLSVFKDIKGDVPEKMSAPSATSTTNSVTLKWKKPSDESVSGYTIRYGTDRNKLGNDTKIDSADTIEYTFSNLSADKTYYFEIAAVNAEGTGVYSDTVDIKTKAESKSDNTGSTGGGGGTGGGGIGGSIGGNTNTNTGSTGTTGGQTAADGKTFTDLSGYDWAEDAIYALKAKGIISGISETEFAPSNNIKRGDFILMLTRMLNIDTPFTENFEDVPTDSYYYNAIGKAKAAGIAQGSGTDFMPEQTITRQDLITLAYRAFLNKGYITEVSDLTALDVFNDKADISEYANAPMASMVAAGIIKGSDGKVNPLGNATRAETAVMCSRLVGLMK